MAIKYRRRCATSLVIRESGLKPSMRSTQPTRMSIVKKWRIAPVNEDVEELEPLYNVNLDVKVVQLLQKTVELPYSTVTIPS